MIGILFDVIGDLKFCLIVCAFYLTRKDTEEALDCYSPRTNEMMAFDRQSVISKEVDPCLVEQEDQQMLFAVKFTESFRFYL